MYMGHGFGFGGPPYGVPIPEEIHNLYPEDIKKAWVVFDTWWKKANSSGRAVRRSDMPKKVSDAMQKILEAPIPENEGKTGKDSCYMVGVLSRLE